MCTEKKSKMNLLCELTQTLLSCILGLIYKAASANCYILWNLQINSSFESSEYQFLVTAIQLGKKSFNNRRVCRWKYHMISPIIWIPDLIAQHSYGCSITWLVRPFNFGQNDVVFRYPTVNIWHLLKFKPSIPNLSGIRTVKTHILLLD